MIDDAMKRAREWLKGECAAATGFPRIEMVDRDSDHILEPGEVACDCALSLAEYTRQAEARGAERAYENAKRECGKMIMAPDLNERSEAASETAHELVQRIDAIAQAEKAKAGR